MESLKATQPSRKYRFPFSIGLAFLFLIALLCGLQGIAPAYADPGTLYVDGATGNDTGNCQNSAVPCQTIGYAIGQAVNGDTILIAGGTYTENLTIKDKGMLAIRGGYHISGTVWLPFGPEATVINGNAAGTVVEIRSPQDVLLEHLTVTGGRGGEDPTFGCGCGGFKIQDSNVTIRDSTIVSNTANSGGVTPCGNGGAICAAGDSRLIHLVIENSIVADNHSIADGGAFNLYHVTGYFTNVVASNNTAQDGNNVFNLMSGSDITIQNSTVSDNFTPGGRAVRISLPPTSTFTARNSIMWNNGQSFVADYPCGNCFVVTYSDVEDGWPGVGNLNQVPLFVSTGDYHLQVGSPCIDKGTPVGAPLYDIEGTPRDAAPDMGAYEWAFRIYLPLTLKNFGP